MTSMGKKRRRAVVDQKACVACGCCVKVCPRSRPLPSSGAWRPGSTWSEVCGLRQVRQWNARPASSRFREVEDMKKALVRLSVGRVPYSICCWASSISCSPGWACCASSFRWLIASSRRDQGLLQPLLRPRPAVWPAGRAALACPAGRDMPAWMKQQVRSATVFWPFSCSCSF